MLSACSGPNPLPLGIRLSFDCLFACWLVGSTRAPPDTRPAIRPYFVHSFMVGFGFGFGFSVSVVLAVRSSLDCLLIWWACAYQLPFLLPFWLRSRRLLSTTTTTTTTKEEKFIPWFLVARDYESAGQAENRRSTGTYWRSGCHYPGHSPLAIRLGLI